MNNICRGGGVKLYQMTTLTTNVATLLIYEIKSSDIMIGRLTLTMYSTFFTATVQLNDTKTNEFITTPRWGRMSSSFYPDHTGGDGDV